jgi:hypothetical protein
MFSAILYMLRQLAIALPPCSFHLFSTLTVAFPKLSVVGVGELGEVDPHPLIFEFEDCANVFVAD